MDAKEVLVFVKENLSYDEATGNFVWRSDRANGKVKRGSIAGSVTNKNYRQIRISGKWYKCHRLVWLLKTGEWPVGQIDHLNRNKLDNRFENLRDVTNYTNCLNRNPERSLPTGVTWDKRNKKWLAQTYIGGVAKNLGRYSSVQLAERAYLKANLERADLETDN
jgi:hypothetical protein